MTEPIVVTQDLTKRFGDFTAVDGVSFKIYPGEVVGYLGPNGSGKTTTIRMLLGLLLPSDGNAQVLGFDSVEQSEDIRSRVGYMSQKFALYDELTVWENIAFYAGVYGVEARSHIEATLERVGMQENNKVRAGDLPVGWRQRLALATAIVHQPQLLFLDEPTSGVDPMARRDFWDLIYALLDEGITAFVTTHYMDEAEYCQRVGIMRRGELLAMDTPDTLKHEAFTGLAWDVFVDELLAAITYLDGLPETLRVGLAGEHIRAITEKGVTAKRLREILKAGGFKGGVRRTEPSLEDVFLALAK
jgi:ABC-2 type transport system ATP-binding protein